MSKPIILVPTDFSPVGDSAVNYAQQLAHKLNAQIKVMHVVAKESEKPKALAALTSISTTIAQSGIESGTHISVGNIFDDIGAVAKDLNARLIVMGTHGVKGMQHIMGSKALKVITNSDVPFIVVQKKPLSEKGFNNIVIPLNFQQEVKQSIKYAWEIGKYFDAKIHIVYLKEKDPFIAAKIERNIPYAEEILQENGVSYEITGIDKSNFSKDLGKFAEKVNADLITIINNQENIFTYFGGSFEQTVIGNEQEIPVLVINAIQLKAAYSFSIYFG